MRVLVRVISTSSSATPFLVVPLLFLSFTVLLTLVSLLRKRILVRVDDLVYELAIRRFVPPDPVTRVAAEAAAAERRGMVGFGGGFPSRVAGEGGGGAGDEVGEDFSVLR